MHLNGKKIVKMGFEVQTLQEMGKLTGDLRF